MKGRSASASARLRCPKREARHCAARRRASRSLAAARSRWRTRTKPTRTATPAFLQARRLPARPTPTKRASHRAQFVRRPRRASHPLPRLLRRRGLQPARQASRHLLRRRRLRLAAHHPLGSLPPRLVRHLRLRQPGRLHQPRRRRLARRLPRPLGRPPRPVAHHPLRWLLPRPVRHLRLRQRGRLPLARRLPRPLGRPPRPVAHHPLRWLLPRPVRHLRLRQPGRLPLAHPLPGPPGCRPHQARHPLRHQAGHLPQLACHLMYR